MLMTKNYIADHWAVLKTKLTFGQDVWKEFEVFSKQVKDIPDDLLNMLYQINKKMYPLHDEITASNNVWEIAAMSYYLLKLNRERVKVRSAVAKLFNEFTEYKTY